MLDKFLKEVKELLCDNPHISVDILPIVLKYTDEKSDSDVAIIRMSMVSLMKELEADKLIQLGQDFHTLSWMRYGEYENEPAYVKGTLKFYEQNIKNPNSDSSVKNETHNYHFQNQGPVINNSSRVTYNENSDSNVMDYLFRIREEVESDRTLNEKRIKLIVETIDEIQESLMTGISQRLNIKNFLSTLSDVSSIGSLVAALTELNK